MENNMRYVQGSAMLHEGARALAERCVALAQVLVGGQVESGPVARGGRKAHELDTHAQLRPRQDGTSGSD
jgi:hypothetical protein